MKKINLSRRAILQSLAYGSAFSVAASLPGVSLSASGGKLTVRFNRDMDSLDPGYYVGGHPDNDVNWACMPALVHYEYVDGMAVWAKSPFVESVEVVSPTRIEFTLKSGLMWSNGYGEVTAEDVGFSYDRMSESEWKGDYVAYDRTEISDKYSGAIILKKAFAPFMTQTLASGTGVIISKKATEAVGGKFTNEVPATCGPYVMEWKQGQYVRLTRNSEWNGELPQFDEIYCPIVTEDSAAALAFEAGELDVCQISSDTYARYQKSPPANSKLTVAGALQYMWLGMNTDHPKLKDIKVRQAIQHAIDINAVNQGAYSGTAELSYGIICPGLIGKRNATNYTYDPVKARSLLDEAGVKNLSVTLRTLNNQERVLASQIIQANLGAIGINVEILPLDSGPFWEMGQESKGDTWQDMEIWLMRYGAGPDPYGQFQWFVRDQVGIWNWERWSSDEFEKLFVELVAVSDSDERHKIAIRMQEIMEETGAYVFLTHEPEVFVHKDNVSPRFAPSGETMLSYFQS